MSERNETFRDFVERELDRHHPETQRECCDVSARASVAYYGLEFYADLDLSEVAEAMASGLFGPAYQNADRTQKLIWCDMCEDALRDAIEDAA